MIHRSACHSREACCGGRGEHRHEGSACTHAASRSRCPVPDGAHDRARCGDILVAEREPARKPRRVHHRPGPELTAFLDRHGAGFEPEYHAVAAAVQRQSAGSDSRGRSVGGTPCVAWSPRRMEALTSAPMRHLGRSSSGCDRSSNRAHALATGNFACAAAALRLMCTKEDGSTRGIALDLPSIGHDAVARVAVVELQDAERTLGDSARGEEVVVLDEHGAHMRVDAGLDDRNVDASPCAPQSWRPRRTVTPLLFGCGLATVDRYGPRCR